MSTVAFLLDAPAPGEGTHSQHPIARLGKYSDPRYGKFAITRQQFTSWKRNLSEIQGGRISIDYDHQAELAAGSTKAAGWITGLTLTTGQALKAQDPVKYADLDSAAEYALADIDWTPEGAQAVRDRYWLFVSPTFQDTYDDEQGQDRGPTLIGVALTNRPFLRQGMPAISLSAAPTLGQGGPAAQVDEGASDSRGMTDFLAKLRTALSLADDAGEDAILTALTTREESTKLSLDARAAQAGQVLLSRQEHADLTAKAGESDALAVRLSTVETELTQDREARKAERFELAYSTALSGGKLTTDEAAKTEWRELYDAAPDTALKRLSALPVIAKGTTTGQAGDDAETPAGVDPDRHRLALRARAIAAEKNLPYTDALTLARQES